MKNFKRDVLNFTFMFGIFLSTNGCSKQDMGNCEDILADIDEARKKYSANPTVSNCQEVVKYYTKYVSNSKCDDIASYINLRDAFKSKNCP